MVGRKYMEMLPGPFPDFLGGTWGRGWGGGGGGGVRRGEEQLFSMETYKSQCLFIHLTTSMCPPLTDEEQKQYS